MELHKIKQNLEKYFEGKTSLQEEKELKHYFSSESVSSELLVYKSVFTYFSQEKTTQSNQKFVLHKNSNTKKWFSAAIVASVAVLLSIDFFIQQPEYLGTFDDPEIALVETQKTLNFIAENINKGKEKICLLQEYQTTKNRIFINQKQ